MADLAALAFRVERLEDGLEQEITKREKGDKYVSNVVEDVQDRYHAISSDISGLKANMQQHLEDDKRMGQSILAMDGRLQKIERLVWIAVGGIAVIAGLISIIASHAFK